MALFNKDRKGEVKENVNAKTFIDAAAGLLEDIQQNRNAYDERGRWTRFGTEPPKRIFVDGEEALYL